MKKSDLHQKLLWLLVTIQMSSTTEKSSQSPLINYKKKHENCHEGFDTALNSDVQLRFNNCVDTYQAVPVLKKLKKGEELPNFSAYLNQDNRFTKNWYIIFCDPTLPEARDLDLDDAPPSKSTKPVFDDDDDLDIDFDALPER